MATCSKCNKRGHLAKACRNPEKFDRPKQKDGNAVPCYSECFISPLQESNNSEVASHLIVDTGCSDHIVNQKELFMNLRTVDEKSVRDPKGNLTAMEGIGDVLITVQSNSGNMVELILNKTDMKRTVGCEGNIIGTCETCAMGKQAGQPIPKKVEKKAKEALKLVYSDVLGPFEVTSLNRSKYAVSFIDEYTKYAVVKYMSNKSQVLDKFKEYVAENGTPRTL